MNFLSSEFVSKPLPISIDIPSHELIEAGSSHAALVENTQQTDASHRKAVGRENSSISREADFDAPSPNIDKQRDFSIQRNAVFDCQVNQAGFLVGLNYIQVDSVPGGNQRREPIAVL